MGVPMIGAERLVAILDEERRWKDLGLYFGAGAGRSSLPGSRFNSLRPNDRDRITAVDVVAVQCLSVTIPIDVTLDLLDGDLGDAVNGLLKEVPDDVDLGSDAATALITDQAPAVKAWHLLDGEAGVGWVTAGKLLSRKRPRLVPVYDTIVRCAAGKPRAGTVWNRYHELLQDATVVERLDRLHRDADLSPDVPRLRVLDVVLWMRHRCDHRRSGCPGLD
jgi:hypothetical protein